MAAEIGALRVRLGLDAGEFQREAKRASGVADKFGKSLRRALSFAAAGVAVQQLVSHTTKAVQSLDRIGKTADKLGVTTRTLQEMRFAAQQTGVQTNTLDMALQRFVRRTAEAAQGTGEAKGALAQMGIALRNSDGSLRSTDELLNDVADAFARIPDQGEKVRLAFKLFDSEGVAMVNTLGKGAAALEAFRRQAREAGFVIEDRVIRNAEKMNDRMNVAQQVIGAQLTEAFVALAPILVNAAELFADVATAIGRVVEGFREIENRSLEQLNNDLKMTRAQLANISATLDTVLEGDPDPLLTALYGDDPDELFRKLKETEKQLFRVQAAIDSIERGRTGTPGATGVDPGSVPSMTGEDNAGGLPPDLQARLDAFMSVQFQEVEALRTATQNKHEILLEAFQNELISREAFNTARLDLEQNYHDRATEIAARAAQEQQAIEQAQMRSTIAIKRAAVSAAVQLTNELVSATGAGAKAAFAIQKALALAEAWINIQLGMTLARATIPPPVGEIVAQQIRVAGLINMGLIAATGLVGGFAKSGGGGGGGGGGGISTRGEGTAAAGAGQTQTVILNVQGDTFGREHLMGIVEGLNALSRDGGPRIVVGGA